VTSSLRNVDVDRFRDIIVRRFGLQFDDAKLAFLGDLLERGAEASETTVGDYLRRLDASSADLRALAQQLTVSETYFFRNLEQFQAFGEVALPDRLTARSSTKQLRLLSAGCASGEEPYSLAILMRERMLDPSWNVTIRAVDLSAPVLKKAALGRYSQWSLRETPEAQRRWFASDGRDFVLDRSICEAVRFDEKNLSLDDPDLWLTGSYDVIFCRNLLMYFVPEAAQRLVARMTRSLAPDGYLFLGHAETLRGLSQDFHLRHTHGTFYYQRKQTLESVDAAPAPTLVQEPLASTADAGWTSTWLETVRHASERIQTLTEDRPAESVGVQPSNGSRKKPELSVALDLLQKERFADALQLLHELPEDVAQDSDALLLRAVLLTHSGDVAIAEKVCEVLLGFDELNAGAHYVLALCRENARDLKGASDHAQIATYLDPTFAMAHLHLGLMARRAGDQAASHRELERAAMLLQREEASRLLLFGGGFSREGLIALCRAELSKFGGAA
jgi:chemotaxis protein methyltransferase CheR